jgi:hypothetical protein
VPGGFAFPATRRSVLERLRDPEPERRRLAFGDLAEGYWKLGLRIGDSVNVHVTRLSIVVP